MLGKFCRAFSKTFGQSGASGAGFVRSMCEYDAPAVQRQENLAVD